MKWRLPSRHLQEVATMDIIAQMLAEECTRLSVNKVG